MLLCNTAGIHRIHLSAQHVSCCCNNMLRAGIHRCNTHTVAATCDRQQSVDCEPCCCGHTRCCGCDVRTQHSKIERCMSLRVICRSHLSTHSACVSYRDVCSGHGLVGTADLVMVAEWSKLMNCGQRGVWTSTVRATTILSPRIHTWALL